MFYNMILLCSGYTYSVGTGSGKEEDSVSC